METSDWNYSRNQFDNATINSYKLADLITKQHDIALQQDNTDPVILTMYNNFHPFRINFSKEYVSWMTMKAIRKSSTRQVENMMSELTSNKIEEWDIKIQGVYRQDSVAYIAILPDRRKPFQKGGYELRISKLKSLAESIEKDALLKDVYDDIILFITEIENARNSQMGLEESLRKQSLKVDTARIVCVELMYANLGGLIQKFYKSPKEIERYFNLEVIRSKSRKTNVETDEFAMKISPVTTKEAGIMFAENTKFLMFNNSSVDLFVYTGLENDSPNPAQMICIGPDEERELSLSEMGMPGSRFLFIVNKDKSIEGEMVINLV
jgi:hypothetical protein